jgi:hypothetical protein
MAAVRFSRIYLLLFALLSSTHICCYSNLTNNDPYPLYTAQYPWTFLTNNLKDCYKGIEPDRAQERFCLSISPFRQAAVIGRNIDKQKVQLGDLKGRWNMIALLYPGYNEDCTINSCTAAKDALLAALGLTNTDITTTCMPSLINPETTDQLKQFGFFSVPIKYRKYGVRFELDVQLIGDLGLKIQGGVCDMIQTATFTDLTCQALGLQCPVLAASSQATCPNSCCIIDEQFGCNCKRLVIQNIMRQKDRIARTLGLNIKNYNHRGAEDTRVSLYWRRIFPINQNRKNYPYFLCMPFFLFEATLPTGERINPNCLFAVPAGNNGHTGLGFSAGVNFDFVETIEIGFQASMTQWNKRNYCNVPVPTNQFQAGMFPYKANYTLKPGTNWEFSAIMNARHFLYYLSTFAQWVVVAHGRDQFCNVVMQQFTTCDKTIPCTTLPVPLINKMSDESRWHSHMINVGFTYDISPNIALGLLWQGPLSRRNAYRSTTILGSVIVTW